MGRNLWYELAKAGGGLFATLHNQVERLLQDGMIDYALNHPDTHISQLLLPAASREIVSDKRWFLRGEALYDNDRAQYKEIERYSRHLMNTAETIYLVGIAQVMAHFDYKTMEQQAGDALTYADKEGKYPINPVLKDEWEAIDRRRNRRALLNTGFMAGVVLEAFSVLYIKWAEHAGMSRDSIEAADELLAFFKKTNPGLIIGILGYTAAYFVDRTTYGEPNCYTKLLEVAEVAENNTGNAAFVDAKLKLTEAVRQVRKDQGLEPFRLEITNSLEPTLEVIASHVVRGDIRMPELIYITPYLADETQHDRVPDLVESIRQQGLRQTIEAEASLIRGAYLQHAERRLQYGEAGYESLTRSPLGESVSKAA